MNCRQNCNDNVVSDVYQTLTRGGFRNDYVKSAAQNYTFGDAVKKVCRFIQKVGKNVHNCCFCLMKVVCINQYQC